jgi:hypothetical protein
LIAEARMSPWSHALPRAMVSVPPNLGEKHPYLVPLALCIGWRISDRRIAHQGLGLSITGEPPVKRTHRMGGERLNIDLEVDCPD